LRILWELLFFNFFKTYCLLILIFFFSFQISGKTYLLKIFTQDFLHLKNLSKLIFYTNNFRVWILFIWIFRFQDFEKMAQKHIFSNFLGRIFTIWKFLANFEVIKLFYTGLSFFLNSGFQLFEKLLKINFSKNLHRIFIIWKYLTQFGFIQFF
jgi:hypothetical protein